MDHHDPYRAPAAVGGPARSKAEGWRISALILIALQVSVYALAAGSGLRAVQAGEISAIAFLAAAAATAWLLAGGVMLWLRSRAGIYLFAASALFACFALLLVRTPTAITGLGIAVIAGLISLRTATPRPPANR